MEEVSSTQRSLLSFFSFSTFNNFLNIFLKLFQCAKLGDVFAKLCCFICWNVLFCKILKKVLHQVCAAE